MAWFASPQQRRADPRTTRLCIALSINRREACGLLDFLDWWAVDFAPKGDLASFSDAEIAYAVEWEGDSGVLVTALVESGYVTTDRQIADWWELFQKYMQRREDKARYERERRAADDAARGRSNGAVGHGHHVTPGPDRTGPTGPTGPDVSPSSPLAKEPSAAVAAEPNANATGDPPRARRGRKRDREATPAPERLTLTPAHSALGEQLGLSPARLEFERGKFLAHHRANANTFPDWDAAFETWLYRAVELGDTGPPDLPGPPAPAWTPPGPHMPPDGAACEPEAHPEPEPTAPEAGRVWAAALGELRLGMSQANFESYLSGTTGTAFVDDQLTVSVSNPLVRETLDQRFRQHVVRALLDVTDQQCRVRFISGRPPPSERQEATRADVAVLAPAVGEREPAWAST